MVLALLLMAGDLAVEMGVPIYGIVGLVHCAMDREGRSVPAPGKGVLTIASEAPGARYSPALSLDYRRSHLQAELQGVEEWYRNATSQWEKDSANMSPEEKQQHRTAISEEYARQKGAAKRQWCSEWWKGHSSISPLRGALAAWNLTVDDVGMCSCHGTSTKLNDKNESDIIQTQMQALGRAAGNPLVVVSQKWLTGHPKGPASSWQVNGAIQAMLSGRIPGNRNLDNVEPVLEANKNLLYTRTTLDVGPLKAVVVTSFGFGQAGGELVLIHPDYFLATYSTDDLLVYQSKRDGRLKDSNKFHEDVIAGRRSYVEVKTSTPYPPEDIKKWMLGKDKRMGGAPSQEIPEPQSGFKPAVRGPATSAVAQVMEQNLVDAIAGSSGASFVGVDVEPISNQCFVNETFLERNYTKKERAECGTTARSYAGLWAGKEAVVKVLGNAGAKLKSAGASLEDVELSRASDGTVSVKLHGYAAEEAARVGVSNLKVSLSYADNMALAAAVSA